MYTCMSPGFPCSASQATTCYWISLVQPLGHKCISQNLQSHMYNKMFVLEIPVTGKQASAEMKYYVIEQHLLCRAMIPNFFGPPEHCNLQNFRQTSFTLIMKLLAESIFMILLWLCSQQWWITLSIMATAWKHNCKCICFPLILVLLIQAVCFRSITKEQRFPSDLFVMHSGCSNCSFAVYSFKWWKFGIKVRSLSDTM